VEHEDVKEHREAIKRAVTSVNIGQVGYFARSPGYSLARPQCLVGRVGERVGWGAVGSEDSGVPRFVTMPSEAQGTLVGGTPEPRLESS
jgi:hypothetical protein